MPWRAENEAEADFAKISPAPIAAPSRGLRQYSDEWRCGPHTYPKRDSLAIPHISGRHRVLRVMTANP